MYVYLCVCVCVPSGALSLVYISNVGSTSTMS